MSEHVTVHRVDGIGKQRTHPDPDPFNPQTFEQAIHGLQKIIVSLTWHDIDHDDRNPGTHTTGTTEDGDKCIHVEPDSMLDNVLTCIPRNWDISILTDQVIDDSYAVRASVNCGDNTIVYITIFVQDGMIRQFTAGHTDLRNPDDVTEVTDLTTYEPSRVITHVNRFFERSVTAAYAKEIPSAAAAFDFIATKEDIPPADSRHPTERSRREQLSQTEWADIRGKTRQTVNGNVQQARNELPTDHPDKAFTSTRPALEELPENTDAECDIRLT